MLRPLLTALCLFAPTLVLGQTCGTRDLIAELDPADKARLADLVAPHAYPEGVLFRAEKAGSTVIVAGTIHIPDPRLQPMVERLEADVAAADVLILEASAEDEAGIQTLATRNPELFFITEGPTLIDLLSEEEWAAVTERLAEIGIPGFLAAKFQPWYLSMTLAIPKCALALVQSGEKGLDRQLEVIALEAGVPIATLDDTEAVLRIFADEPIEKQLDGLRIGLEMQADGDASTSTMIEGYFSGRVRETWEYGRLLLEDSELANGAEMFDEINQALLLDRNQAWEPEIAKIVDGKNSVLAVGAAHLSGETGVLRALERAGFEISPY